MIYRIQHLKNELFQYFIWYFCIAILGLGKFRFTITHWKGFPIEKESHNGFIFIWQIPFDISNCE
jgi:hypothetical protein